MQRQSQSRVITVLAGPARCGKTENLLARAVEMMRSGRRVMLLVPGVPGGRVVRGRLLAELGAIRDDPVITFVALAERVLAAAGVPVRAVSADERELLLRSVTSRLAAAGKISFFRDALTTAGFYAELQAFIRELKAWQIAPEKFGRFPTRTSPRDVELGRIYSAYQEALAKSNLYDSEGRFWQARLVLEKACPLAAPDALFLDGFTDFTPNEMTLLEVFARWVPEVVATLPWEESRRGGLFAKTDDTLGRLKRRFKVRVEPVTPCHSPTATARIAEALFAKESVHDRVPSAGAIKVISTAGVTMEVTEIAREAKRLIRKGARPADIAILARRPRRYLRVARDVFARLGVPLDSGSDGAGEASGLFGFLDALINVVEGGFERRDVVAVLSSSYVDLPRLAGGSIDGADIARIATKAGVVRGAAQWEKRLKALRALTADRASRDLQEADDEDDDGAARQARRITVAKIDLAAAAVNRLSELMMPLGKPALPRAAAAATRAIFDQVGVRSRIFESHLPDEVLFRDLSAFAAIDETLENICSCRSDSAAMSAREFAALVGRLAGARSSGDGRISVGGVQFLSLPAARNLSFPVVFICGLTAEAFPGKFPVGPFYNRAERAQLASEGLGARNEELHLAAERLLFYQAATRAEKTLYLTYASTDEEGKLVLRSFYVEELLGLFDVADEDRHAYGPSRAIVGFDEAACPAEVAVAAGASIAAAKNAQDAVPPAVTASRIVDSFAFSLRSGAVEARRDGLRKFDRFDGVLTDACARLVAEGFAPGVPWSEKRLNAYLTCPFSFFLSYVLGAERPDEPGQTLPAIEEGSIAHAVLALFFTEVRDRCLRGEFCSGLESEALRSAFEKAFESVADDREKRFGLSADAFWEVERRRVKAMIERFLADELDRLCKPDKEGVLYEPRFFELSFGLGGASSPDEIEDTSSAIRPVAVELAGRREYVCGRIDRVDRMHKPSPRPDGSREPLADTPEEVAVLDYKRSTFSTAKAVKELKDMQMPVYLLAARALLGGKGKILPARAFYRSLRSCKGHSSVLDFACEEDYEVFEQKFVQAMFDIVGAVRRGRFPAAPPTGKCPDYCIGRGVCRYNEARVEFLKRGDGQDNA